MLSQKKKFICNRPSRTVRCCQEQTWTQRGPNPPTGAFTINTFKAKEINVVAFQIMSTESEKAVSELTQFMNKSAVKKVSSGAPFLITVRTCFLTSKFCPLKFLPCGFSFLSLENVLKHFTKFEQHKFCRICGGCHWYIIVSFSSRSKTTH